MVWTLGMRLFKRAGAFIAATQCIGANALTDYIVAPLESFLSNLYSIFSVVTVIFLVSVAIIVSLVIFEYIRLSWTGDIDKPDDSSENETRYNYFWPKKLTLRYQAQKIDKKAKKFQNKYPDRYTNAPETIIKSKPSRIEENLRRRNIYPPSFEQTPSQKNYVKSSQSKDPSDTDSYEMKPLKKTS